ncbi:MAG TPA: hypothetical protein VFH68_13045 [Polyangia bacterium]|jgi:hypothetical protein|nr:hypothetical protein [Polyangia bacterium]
MRTLIGTLVLIAIDASAARAFAQNTAAPAPAPAPGPTTAPPGAADPALTPPAAPTGGPASTAVATGAPAMSAPPTLSAALAPTPHGPTVWGVLPWGGVGIGGRYVRPLGIPPLLRNGSVRDNFSFEVGVDLLRWTYEFNYPGLANYSYTWTEILPVGGIMWNLWLNDSLAVYPKAEAGYAFGWFSNLGNGAGVAAYDGTFVAGAVGALYNVGAGLTLRAEAGSAGLRLGAGWLF